MDTREEWDWGAGSRQAVLRPFRLGRWVGWVAAGESVGFLAPTAGFALTSALGLNPWTAYALMIVLGAVEGALLGLGQVAGLRGTAGGVPARSWIAVTAMGAALAWSLGMLPPTLVDAGVPVDITQAAVWLLIGLGGLVLLASIPLAQWTVLRGILPRAWRWIPVNMGAWLAGLVFPFLPGPFVDAYTPTALLAVLYVAAGAAMATTVETLTGLWLRRAFPHRESLCC